MVVQRAPFTTFVHENRSQEARVCLETDGTNGAGPSTVQVDLSEVPGNDFLCTESEGMDLPVEQCPCSTPSGPQIHGVSSFFHARKGRICHWRAIAYLFEEGRESTIF